jgi:predicted nucleic acid-binding protein
MIIVLDTNIVASATFWRGRPAHCLEAWVIGKFDLAISHPILTEYEEVVALLGSSSRVGSSFTACGTKC